MQMHGHDRPSVLPGPDGVVSIIGIVFEGDAATLDNGALHARSHLEVGIRFSEDPAAKGAGERLVNTWVSYPGARAEKFHGACTAEAWVDRAKGTGWKRPIDHVNRMTAAVRGKVDVADLNAAQRKSLAQLLATFAPDAWARANEELRQALA